MTGKILAGAFASTILATTALTLAARDPTRIARPGTLGFAKWVGEVHEADRLPEYIARAFHTATQGRPGPVVLVLPEDMLTTPTTAPVLPRAEPAHAWPAPGALRDLRAMLLAAQRPPAYTFPLARSVALARLVGRFGSILRLATNSACFLVHSAARTQCRRPR